MASGFVWAASLSFHEGHIYSPVLFYTYTFLSFKMNNRSYLQTIAYKNMLSNLKPSVSY